MSLAQKTCTPCQGGIPPLNKQEAEHYRAKSTPEWALVEDGRMIERQFTFKNYVEAEQFVLAVGKLAEEENHHPDISFGWGYATIRIQTHKIDGLHENDFILAAKIDGIG